MGIESLTWLLNKANALHPLTNLSLAGPNENKTRVLLIDGLNFFFCLGESLLKVNAQANLLPDYQEIDSLVVKIHRLLLGIFRSLFYSSKYIFIYVYNIYMNVGASLCPRYYFDGPSVEAKDPKLNEKLRRHSQTLLDTVSIMESIYQNQTTISSSNPSLDYSQVSFPRHFMRQVRSALRRCSAEVVTCIGEADFPLAVDAKDHSVLGVLSADSDFMVSLSLSLSLS